MIHKLAHWNSKSYLPSILKIFGDFIFAVGSYSIATDTSFYVLNTDLKMIDTHRYKFNRDSMCGGLNRNFGGLLDLKVFKHRGMIHGLLTFAVGCLGLFVFRKSMISIVGNFTDLDHFGVNKIWIGEIRGTANTSKNNEFLVYAHDYLATIKLR